jgi:tetratricopeptide (TPR) repeat protein
MSSHRIIWTIAGTIVFMAALVIMTREAGDPHEEAPPDAEPATANELLLLKDAMMTALQNDPEIEDEQTQAAVTAVAEAVGARADAEGQAGKNVPPATTGADAGGPEGQYAMGLYYTEHDLHDQAEKAFRRAIELRPDWSWPHTGLAILLANHMQGRMAEAEAELRKAIAIDPDWYRPHNSLAVLLRLAGRLPEAELEALQALDLNPYSLAAHNNYANLLTVQNKYPQAEKMYLKAIELNARHPKPYYNLACLYARQNQKDQCLPLLAKACSLDAALREEALKDPDFKNIAEDPLFLSIVKPNPELE